MIIGSSNSDDCEQPVSALRSRVARYLILYVVNILDILYRGNLTSRELLGAILYVRVSRLGFCILAKLYLYITCTSSVSVSCFHSLLLSLLFYLSLVTTHRFFFHTPNRNPLKVSAMNALKSYPPRSLLEDREPIRPVGRMLSW